MNSVRIIKADEESDEVSLKDILLKVGELSRYLRSKWIFIMVFGVVGCILGFVYAQSKKQIYTATTTFVLEDGGSRSGALAGLGGLASMVGVDVGAGGGVFQGDNILELYKSRSMIERALLTKVSINGRSQLLVDRFIDFNNLKELWSKDLGLSKINFDSVNKNVSIQNVRLKDSILSDIVLKIRSSLNVQKPDKKLSIISVEFKSYDEFFAKTFNEEIVKNVNDFYMQTRIKKSLNNITILQHKTDSVRSVMNGAIYNSASIADGTPNLNPTRQAQRVAPMQRSQFSAETNKAILAELVKNLEMAKITLSKDMPLIQVIDYPIFPLEKQVLSKIKGSVIGGFLLALITVIWLLFKKFLTEII